MKPFSLCKRGHKLIPKNIRICRWKDKKYFGCKECHREAGNRYVSSGKAIDRDRAFKKRNKVRLAAYNKFRRGFLLKEKIPPLAPL